MAHTHCMLDYQGYMHLLACTRLRARLPTCAHARSSMRTHTQICNTYCFSTATTIRYRVSVLRYTYIACVVSLLCHNSYVFSAFSVNLLTRYHYMVHSGPHYPLDTICTVPRAYEIIMNCHSVRYVSDRCQFNDAN